MRTLRFLLQKEFRQIFRNKTILRMIISLPLVQLLITPMAADYEIKNINISVTDHDHSTTSQKLINEILSSRYFRLSDYSPSFEQSFEQFQKDKSDLILEIPARFEKDLVRENKSALFVAVNAVNGMKARIGSLYLMRIISGYNVKILERQMPTTANRMPTIEVLALNWFNPNLNYPFFMVPGILVVLVTMVGGYMCALNIVKEKETGTIEQINVTPIKKYYFILGKLIPFWAIGIFIYSLGLLAVARFVYGIVPAGSLWLLYGFLGLYLIALLGLGLLISTYSSTQQQAISLAFFCVMIFILMSGLFTPIDSMPDWAQWIARFNPVTYFIEVQRMAMLKGSTFKDVQMHFLAMTGFAVFFNGWAILNYRKTN